MGPIEKEGTTLVETGKRKFIFTLLMLLCITFVFPTIHPEAADYTVTVNTDNLTVRSGPSLQDDYMTTIHKGEKYHFVKKVGDWIQINLPNGDEGWVADYLVFVQENELDDSDDQTNSSTLDQIFITHNGTNIRKNPNTLSTILARANKGDAFEVVDFKNDWYQIKLQNGQTGYVAEWLISEKSENLPQTKNVEVSSTSNDHLENYLQGKKIVIDPGHGGKDKGTTGASGTLEKNITMETATRLYNKLKNAGAEVTLTRYKDQYITLPTRVAMSDRMNADAFISIHYDSFNDGAEGATTFFYHPWQKELAVSIHSSIIDQTNIHNRGVRKGDYYVIRENSQNAVLVELGFLSNPSEELLITSQHYQILVTTGIYEGLARYFKNQY
ncbi:N-acetylmuramoyl-L-alanine amidase [Niallia sp. Krafla_26]|uniref:N-acetylmuramoyl-L-alanine amidase n=1 Tax=Niallia sp. Krafla_26 TaxID=3064703 RepID=UPI003D173D26